MYNQFARIGCYKKQIRYVVGSERNVEVIYTDFALAPNLQIGNLESEALASYDRSWSFQFRIPLLELGNEPDESIPEKA
jgi:hypothetical protein